MRGNHSAGEEEQCEKKRKLREGWRRWCKGGRRGGEEETVIISSPSCESQPVLQSLLGKLEMHTNCLYSESVLPDSTTTTKQRPLCHWSLDRANAAAMSVFTYLCSPWSDTVFMAVCIDMNSKSKSYVKQ